MSAWTKFRRLRWWWQALAWVFAWPVSLGLWAFSLPRERRLGPLLLAVASGAVWIAVVLASGAENRRQAATGTTSTTSAAGVVIGDGQTTTTTAVSTTSSTEAIATTTSGDQTTSSTSSSTTGPTSSSTTTTTSTPTTTTTTAQPPPSGGMALLPQLRIAPEGPRTGYSRDLFKHWIDADGDRCDTREEVLIAESLTPAQVDPYGCKVVAGDWLSTYDGMTTDQPGDLDIDHVVALAEAWDSGASAWDAARREAFANDLDEPAALIAVSASSNRSKSDNDPAEWKPPRQEAWCQFSMAWITVKLKWDLSADQLEYEALRRLLTSC